MKLYKVSANGNTIYIRANSWFEIFSSLLSQAKTKGKFLNGVCIMPVKTPILCAKQAGFPDF